MIDKNFVYAIVWASSNPEKYWNKILQDLLAGGYKAIPVNPSEELVLWQKVYAQITDIPTKVDVVIFVVPPIVTEKVMDEVIELWIKNVRMQPGAESDLAIQKAQTNNINLIYNSCIMVQRTIA